MKEIEQIVTDYLKAKKTDYALMINGDWGSGKTYFIKESLFSTISAIDSFLIDKKNQILKYEPLYVSLYGVADMSDVLYKVQIELNPWLKSKTWHIAKTGLNKLASVFNSGLSNDDEKNILSIFNIQKNRLLFFDDLERIDQSKLSLSSVLGQINHFTEQDHLKVIIVCNSEEVDKIFSKINEKTVRFSCLYDPNLKNVYNNMLSEYSQNYADFLKQRKQTIIEIFEWAKYKNLRTLRFILDIYQKIYGQVGEADYKDEILKQFLFFTTIYSIEYKIGGHSAEELNSLKNVGPFFLSDIDFNNFTGKEQEEQVETEKSYVQLFNEKYSDLTESFHYCQEIADYIHDGYLNEEKFADVIKEIIQDIKRKEETEENKLIKEIRNWRELKDDGFEPLVKKILQKIDEGTLTLMAYPLIFAEFLQFEFYKLDNFDVSEDIIERFKKGIDKSKETHTYFEAFRYKLPLWSDRDITPARGKYLQISNYVIDANDFALTKEYVSISDLILTHLEENKSDELQEIITDQSLWGSPLFESMDPTKIFNLFLNANSETISAFNIGLYGRYPENSVNTFPSFQKERTFFVELHILIENYILAVKPIKISTVQFIDLDRNLRRIINL